MATSDDIVLAFDLYGTLLSTASIATKLASHFGQDTAAALAKTWRSYQEAYTWRLTTMNQYEPFSTVTRGALLNALADFGLSLSEEQIAELMRAYDDLETFDDVIPALEALKAEKDLDCVIFSNGTEEMVSNSVHKSRHLSPYSELFRELIVVGEVKRYKPAREVYWMLAKKLGKGTWEESMGTVWLVSGNPFDIVGARAVGMQAAWVDRAGSGWKDALVAGERGRPTVVVRTLGEVVDAVKEHTR